MEVKLQISVVHHIQPLNKIGGGRVHIIESYRAECYHPAPDNGGGVNRRSPGLLCGPRRRARHWVTRTSPRSDLHARPTDSPLCFRVNFGLVCMFFFFIQFRQREFETVQLDFVCFPPPSNFDPFK